MGFSRDLVVAGLRQTDNNGPATINLLAPTPELLQQAIAKDRHYTEEQVRIRAALSSCRMPMFRRRLRR